MALTTPSRSTLVRGPAKCTFNSATFFTRNSFEIKVGVKTDPERISAYGEIDQRMMNPEVSASFQPDGRISAAIIAAFWPYGLSTMVPGTSCATAADLPFVAVSTTETATIIAAYVEKMPDLILGSSESLIGEMTVGGVIGANKDPDDASGFYTTAAGATITDTTFSAALIKRQRYSAVHTAITGFTTIIPKDKFTCSFEVELKDEFVNGALVDKVFQSARCLVKCEPIGPTSSQTVTALNIQGAAGSPGRLASAQGNSLIITGEDSIAYLTLPSATIVTAGFRFGSDVLRPGEIGFLSQVKFTAGVASNRWTIAAS